MPKAAKKTAPATEIIEEERAEQMVTSRELEQDDGFEDADSDQTDSSDDMDAQLILEHPIDEKTVKEIKAKTRIKKAPVSSNSNPKPQRSLEASQDWLQQGIECVKVNFSDSKMKQVILKLSRDLKTLQFERPAKDQGWWDRIRGPSKLHLKDVVDILYGGGSSAMKPIARQVLRLHSRDRDNAHIVFDHYDQRRNIFMANENHEIKLLRHTLITEPDKGAKGLSAEAKVFNWQFVSLVRANATTLDLIVRRECDLMALINVVQQAIFKPAQQNRLLLFKTMRFKMLVGFMAWNRHLNVSSLFQQAIMQTLVEKLKVQVAVVQKSVPRNEDGE